MKLGWPAKPIVSPRVAAAATIVSAKATPEVALAPVVSAMAAVPAFSGGTSLPAVRELSAHARELGVALEGRPMSDVIADIQRAELALGKKHDARVNDGDMARAARWSAQAASLVPAQQTDLFGFTRVIDVKLELTSATFAALASGCDRATLLRLIDAGPEGRAGDLAWAKPTTREEVVASLVRQVALGAGASKQIVLDPSLAGWLDDTLQTAGITTKKAMGGAGAFAANLAASVGVNARFFSKDKLPAAIAERFSRMVSVIDGAGHSHPTSAYCGSAAARTNTAAEYAAGQAMSLFGLSALLINGKQTPLSPSGSGRVIMGTQAKDVAPGFADVDDAALRKMAQGTNLFFFVGAHYLTQGSEADAQRNAQELGRGLTVMKEENPSLLRHMQYVVPKVMENEPVVLLALKGSVDSLALNAVEAAPLMDTLYDAGMTTFDVDPHQPRTAAEDPLHMLESALALVDALALSRTHLHGFDGDLLVSRPGTPGHADPERQKLALLKARQIASNKAANDTGEIKSADDIWPVVPSVRGPGLAALHRFADALQARFGLSDRERALVVERWWFKDPGTETVIHFVPSRGIHDRTGGTVSLGDTIDASALIFAMPERSRPRVPHPSSFGW